jgi:proline iminopeptidase
MHACMTVLCRTVPYRSPYCSAGGWFPQPDYVLDNIDRIRDKPCVIVQGRYDVVCPMITSWHLHRAWPEAAYHVVTHAGHSAMEAEVPTLLTTVCP